MQILVIYDSKTGNTRKMATAVAEGAKEIADINVVMKSAEDSTNQDLLESDGIIIGSPTYYGQMSGKVKTMFDKSVAIHGKLEGKVGAAFTSSGGVATGAETTIMSILEAMLIHGMIVQGRTSKGHYGAASVGEPQPKENESCKNLGRMVAQLAKRLKSSPQ